MIMDIYSHKGAFTEVEDLCNYGHPIPFLGKYCTEQGKVENVLTKLKKPLYI